MPEYRIEGKHAAETADWLTSIASLVIERHIGAGRETASDVATGVGSTNAARRLWAQWIAMEPCVESLGPRQRLVVELRFREGMSYADIARRLDIPVGTVRSRLSRARALMNGLAPTSANQIDTIPANSVDVGLVHPAGLGVGRAADSGTAEAG